MTLTLAITAVTASTVLGSIIDATSNNEIKQEPLQQGMNALAVFDIGIVVVNASFYLAGILLGVRIRSNPVFAVPALLFIAVGTWLSSEIANIYYMFGQTPVISQYAQNFTMTNTFMSNLPTITLGLSTIMAIVLFTGIGRGRIQA
jgi:hypothetical protein